MNKQTIETNKVTNIAINYINASNYQQRIRFIRELTIEY